MVKDQEISGAFSIRRSSAEISGTWNYDGFKSGEGDLPSLSDCAETFYTRGPRIELPTCGRAGKYRNLLLTFRFLPIHTYYLGVNRK